MFDAIDRKILELLQSDADRPISDIADQVGLSATPCWRRIKRLEDEKVITRRVAIVDQHKLNLPVTLMVHLRAPRQDDAWKKSLTRLVAQLPEVLSAVQVTGENAFCLYVVAPDMGRFRFIQQRLSEELGCASISANVILDTIKSTTAVPTAYASGPK
jgi:Lrp/AsnC family transcriptional regulator